GCYILWKSLRIELETRRPASWTGFLGFAAGFLDASGGGGGGPMTTPPPLGAGAAARPSVCPGKNPAFFLAVAAGPPLLAEIGAVPLDHFLPLVIGGVLAAPLGGWLVKHIPAQKLMMAVGLLIVAVSIFQLLRAFRVI